MCFDDDEVEVDWINNNKPGHHLDATPIFSGGEGLRITRVSCLIGSVVS